MSDTIACGSAKSIEKLQKELERLDRELDRLRLSMSKESKE